MLILSDAKHAEPKTWDPVRKRMAGWINLRVLNSVYDGRGACTIM